MRNEEEIMNTLVDAAVKVSASTVGPSVLCRWASGEAEEPGRRQVMELDAHERFIEDLLATFSNRWEW